MLDEEFLLRLAKYRDVRGDMQRRIPFNLQIKLDTPCDGIAGVWTMWTHILHVNGRSAPMPDDTFRSKEIVFR